MIDYKPLNKANSLRYAKNHALQTHQSRFWAIVLKRRSDANFNLIGAHVLTLSLVVKVWGISDKTSGFSLNGTQAGARCHYSGCKGCTTM